MACIRLGLHLALLHQPSGDDGLPARRRPDLIHEKKISISGPGADPGEGGPSGKPLLIIAEDRRCRGADAPGRQQASRRAQRLRGEGVPALATPQGHARRHRRAHRRHADQRGLGIQLDGDLQLEHLGRAKRSPSIRQQHDRRRGRQAGRHRQANPADEEQIRPDRKRVRQGEVSGAIAKLAGGVAVISVGRENRSRHEAEEAASRTPCTPPAPRSRKASCPRWRRLLRCTEVVQSVPTGFKGDERIGVDIILHALAAPSRRSSTTGAATAPWLPTR